METFIALFWLIVAFSVIIAIAKFSNRKTEQNTKYNYKKEISNTDIIDCLDRIDRAYVGCLKVLVKALMDIEPINEKNVINLKRQPLFCFSCNTILQLQRKFLTLL